MSKEAEMALKYFSKKVHPKHLDLTKAGSKVRSFEHITELSFLTAQEAVKLADHSIILDKENAA